ncbi:adenylate cyclase [Nocardia transvalensis]|uniref:Adenylate cyclase n=1 Tax=Nocardia transvalensis TaxID=37333 RepID=A0A7W9PI46_9NOCA|nr:adenylate/guanylate cyclase domain-containing protein [Nocardia transvalensis]MBB5916108.1 adenylate cyclase [Nocardia transvalensis]
MKSERDGDAAAEVPQGATEYGSVLLGSRRDSPARRRARVQLLLTVSVVTANAVGVAVVLLLGTVGIPNPDVFAAEVRDVAFVYLPIYVVAAFVVGASFGTAVVLRMLRWSTDTETAPTQEEARSAFRAPWVLTTMQAVLWIVGTASMTTLYGLRDPELIPKALLVSLFSAAVVCAASYLLTEFAMRPYAALALAAHPAMRRRGLTTRSLVTWLLGSGVPVAGIVLVVAFGAADDRTTKRDLLLSVGIIGVMSFCTGLLLTYLGTDRIGAPLRSVILGMERVRRDGRTETIAVYDGTEMGELQAGFNAMVDGLTERERLRDLFGRHVGPDVVRAALDRGVQLGGETRDVGVLFVDVVGSTTMASRLPPHEVVDTLNRFFGVIVAAVHRRDGLINKFEGDAALAVFGAPTPHPDPAGAALAAAAEITRELAAADLGIEAGVGVSYGEVVAGNIGAEDRYEYTVIGDPVNESARLSELAKRDTRLPLASERAVTAATGEQHWKAVDKVVLRGRQAPTQLYQPEE